MLPHTTSGSLTYQSLLEVWLRLMRETGSPPEQIERQADNGVYGLEDGFGTILTLQSWRLIQKAIEEEAQIHIPPTNGRMAFVLDWDITERN